MSFLVAVSDKHAWHSSFFRPSRLSLSLSLFFFFFLLLLQSPTIFSFFTAVTFIFQSSSFSSKRIHSTFIFLSKTGSGLPLFFHFFFSEFQVKLESFIFLYICVFFFCCCRFCFVLLNSIREMDMWGVFGLFKLEESLMIDFDFYIMR